MTPPALSIVVPALNEAAGMGALLSDLRSLASPHEVIVVDGGSTDDTAEVARSGGARVVTSSRGRGRQLRAGVLEARAPVLCMLHADVRVPRDTLAALDGLARDGCARAIAFRLRIDAPGLAFRVVERGAALRARWLGLPYGDQGLALDRATYDAVGGYADVPLMEDVLLVRALRARGGVGLRPETLLVSARRWQRDGVWRRSARNLAVLARWALGATPASLHARYERSRTG